MDRADINVVIVIAVLVATVLIWARQLRSLRRANAARRFAQANGWSFSRSVSSLTSRWRSAPFDRGSRRRASDVLSRTVDGRSIVSFEYSFSTPGRSEYRTYSYYHVVALSLPVPMPWLQLSHEGAGDAVATVFGGQDVEFESEAFNQVWRVKAPPGRYAYDVIHPRMMERLLAPDAIGTDITVEGSDIYLHVRGFPVLEAIDGYVTLLEEICDLIPRHVWLNLGYDPLARQA